MVLGYKTDEDTGKDGPHPVPVEEIPVVREIKVDEEVATSQLDCVASVKVVKVDLPEVDFAVEVTFSLLEPGLGSVTVMMLVTKVVL